ncbi:hypothetical protein [Candidatus Entotheonella palauensis]|nr:hypothetical protein [Candidatus Entotheonella palauensis]
MLLAVDGLGMERPEDQRTEDRTIGACIDKEFSRLPKNRHQTEFRHE